MRDGECSAHPTPALRTKENASGLLPTIKATDGDRGDLLAIIRGLPNRHCGTMWQTPVADDHVDRMDGKFNSRGEPKLSAQVKNSSNRRPVHGGTTTQSMWPTPHGFSLEDQISQSIGVNTGSLNPSWVEWLMGWPIGWTDLNPLVTAKFQQWLDLHGKR
jgi:hypothetical protein